MDLTEGALDHRRPAVHTRTSLASLVRPLTILPCWARPPRRPQTWSSASVLAGGRSPPPRRLPRPPPPWVQDIDETIAGHDVSVAIGSTGAGSSAGPRGSPRAGLEPEARVLDGAPPAHVAGHPDPYPGSRRAPWPGGVLRGNLDRRPAVTRSPRWRRPPGQGQPGIPSKCGGCMGSTRGLPARLVGARLARLLPGGVHRAPATALTFDGNVAGERTSATSSIARPGRSPNKLRGARREGQGRAAPGRRRPASGSSPPSVAPFEVILRRMNRTRNFHAGGPGQVARRLRFGGKGTIAKAGRAIERFAGARGVEVVANDSSGLSYANRVAPATCPSPVVRGHGPWGGVLRAGLAAVPGTLRGPPPRRPDPRQDRHADRDLPRSRGGSGSSGRAGGASSRSLSRGDVEVPGGGDRGPHRPIVANRAAAAAT